MRLLIIVMVLLAVACGDADGEAEPDGLTRAEAEAAATSSNENRGGDGQNDDGTFRCQVCTPDELRSSLPCGTYHIWVAVEGEDGWEVVAQDVPGTDRDQYCEQNQ